VRPGVLLGRLLVVACAFLGLGLALSRLNDPWPALSQQASLVAGVVYAGLVVFQLGTGREPRTPWWRGSMVVLLMLVCATYIFVLQGSLGRPWSLFEHLITPLVVLAEFLVAGGNQSATKWWHPVTWLGLPLVYLIYYLVADLHLYGSFLNPQRNSFPAVITGFILALLALGYLLYGYGRLRRVTPRTSDPAQ
jgi:hypothetical protein